MEQSDNTGRGADRKDRSLVGRVVFWGLLLLIVFAPLKFGNPTATQSVQYPPRTMEEWIGNPWSSHAWLNQWFAVWVLVLLALSYLEFPMGKRGIFRNRPRLAWGIIGSVFLFCIVQMASAARSVNPGISVETVSAMGAYCVVAFLAARHARNVAAVKWILGAVALSAVAICWYAIIQHHYPSEVSWDAIYRVVDSEHEAVRMMQKIRDGRAFATLVYPNTLGGFLVVAFPAVLAMVWQWREKFTRSAMAALMILVAAIGATALAFTKSNGSFLALGVSLVATLLLWRAPWKRKILIAVAGAILLSAFYGVAYGPKRLSGGMSTSAKRLDYWKAAVSIAERRPALGFGPGTFGELYVGYIKPDEFEGGIVPEEPRMAHNGFLQMATDSGVLAVVGFAAIWLFSIFGVARAYRRANDSATSGVWLAVFAGLVGWTAHELVDFDLYVPGVAVIAFVCAGLVLGTEWRHAGDSAVQAPEESRRSRAGGFYATLFCRIPGALIWLVVAGWLIYTSTANYGFIAARESAQDGNLGNALNYAEEAVRRAPYNAFYRGFVGELQSAVGQLTDAEESYRRATTLAPYQAGHHYRAAIVRWKRTGRVDELVLRDLERAARLYAAHPTFRQTLEEAQKQARASRPSP